MYVYCIYPAMPKTPKQLSLFSKKSRNKRRSNHFLLASSVKYTLILLPFCIVAQHESGTTKDISWSVTVKDACSYI